MKNLVLALSYEKDLKRLEKKHYDLEKIETPVEFLLNGKILPTKYKDHALFGNLQGKRELHIQLNWLLMYKSTDAEITLIRTGSHDDLYK
jgi:mRNA interferase YafQ